VTEIVLAINYQPEVMAAEIKEFEEQVSDTYIIFF